MTSPPRPPESFRLAGTPIAPTPPRGRSRSFVIPAGVAVIVAMSALVLVWPPAIFAVAVVIIAGGYVTSVVYQENTRR